MQKRTVLTQANGLVLSEVKDRDDAIGYLLSKRKAGAFMVVTVADDRISIQYLLLRARCRGAAAYSSHSPGNQNWDFIDDFDWPRTVVQAACEMASRAHQALAGSDLE